MEAAILNFVRERHARNHIAQPSSDINIFYDSFKGRVVLDAWVARLTVKDTEELREIFTGFRIHATDIGLNWYDGGVRKRADSGVCSVDLFPSGRPPGSQSSLALPTPFESAPSYPKDLPATLADSLTASPSRAAAAETQLPSTFQPVAATAVIGNAAEQARLCVDQCKTEFTKCTYRPDGGSVSRRKRSVAVIDCQAVGNCFCAETPYLAGPTRHVDVEKALKICSDTCAGVRDGTQKRLGGGLVYTSDDLWECLAQAQSKEWPDTNQPVGCMGK
ncbi:MAG: hypothetical protein Q9220_003886 [cf. Caloplaca sp. 1 TL-2023]